MLSNWLQRCYPAMVWNQARDHFNNSTVEMCSGASLGMFKLLVQTQLSRIFRCTKPMKSQDSECLHTQPLHATFWKIFGTRSASSRQTTHHHALRIFCYIFHEEFQASEYVLGRKVLIYLTPPWSYKTWAWHPVIQSPSSVNKEKEWWFVSSGLDG